MAEEIYANHVQHNTYKEYEVGTCDPSKCNTDKENNCDWNIYENGVSVRDWRYGEKTCRNACRNIALCSGINPSNCPVIGEDYRQIWDDRNNPPNVVCIYPANIFRLKENVDMYISHWGMDENYNNIIMPQYCSEKITTCPEGTNNLSFKSCSRMVSTGLDGLYCREWGKNNKKIFEKTAAQYCSENDTLDCSCFTEKTCSVCSHHSYLSNIEILSELSMCDDNKKGIDLDELALSGIEEDKDNIVENKDINNQSNVVLEIVIALVIIVVLLIIVLMLIKWSRRNPKYTTY